MSPAGTPTKRARLHRRPPGQPSIESFFKPPRPGASPPADSVPASSSTQTRRAQSSTSGLLEAVPATVEVIDVDLVRDSDSDIEEVGQSPSLPASQESRSRHYALVPQSATMTSATPPKYPDLSADPANFAFETCFWPSDAHAPYSFLVHVLCALSATRSRIAILSILTNALRTITRYHPSSLLPSLYLLSNSLSPPYVSIELGLGPSIISKAIQHVSGITPAALKRLYNQTGDPGDVAFLAKSNVRTLVPHAPLSIHGVYDALLKIAQAKGKGAVNQKQAMVEKLLVAAKGEETRYLVRTLSQHIRVGAVRTSILTALARALVLTPPATIAKPAPSRSLYTASADLLAQARRSTATSSKKGENDSKTHLQAMFTKAEGLLKRVFVQHPNYEHIVAAIQEVGLDGLAERVPLTVGIPLQPALGSPMRSLDDVYERINDLPFTAEYKYDGQRVQIHAEKSNAGKPCVKLFSRHLEDMTEKYPDVVYLADHFLASAQGTSSFVVDAEIVAIDPNDGSLKSFQELSNRPRKDVKLHEIKVSVCVYAFDLMFLNGQSLLQEPFRVRRELLRKNFAPVKSDQTGAARFDHVESCESEVGREEIEEFWLRAVDSRCEGLMIKLLDHGEVLESTGPRKEKTRKQPLPATYEPDKRTSAWLKLKKDYVTGLGDTLDLVPVGAWHGNGRKAQWWSPVLLALRDTGSGRLVAVCKCMSGFSDSFYKSMRERYSEDSEDCSRFPLWGDVEAGGYSPGVYFRPHEVWEIRGADVTLSPVSVAAKGSVSEDRGLSLRFPRFIRTREDKSIEQASSTDFLVGIYRQQQGLGKDHGGADDGQLIDAMLSDDALEDDWEEGELD
ncbi:DNA ligase [Gloeopeniophorella convolvens]|nr:DNA ligase [Gloeopeniophorella convolvens]